MMKMGVHVTNTVRQEVSTISKGLEQRDAPLGPSPRLRGRGHEED